MSLDAWIADQPDPKPSRPEAIRSLLDKALAEGASRLPFEAGQFSYANIPPGQFTLSDMTGAFNGLVQHLSGGKPEVEQIALSSLARLLTERVYLQANGEALKVEFSG